MTNTTHMIDTLEMAAHHDWALITQICDETMFLLDPCDYNDLIMHAEVDLSEETDKLKAHIYKGYRS